MLLLALAIAPGLAICLYIFYRDAHNREPAINLVMSFFLGMVAIVPAIFVELIAFTYFQKDVISIIISSYLGIGLVEEGSKFIVLRNYCFTRRSFDEPLDGIVYSVMVSMGFATLENVGYTLEHGYTVGFLRMITSVPAHATFAIVMGYYAGKAKFDLVNRNRFLWTGLLGAAFFHGTYNMFIFLTENAWLKQFVSELLLVIGATISLFVAVTLSRKLIYQHRLLSQQLFKTAPILTIRNASVNDVELIRTICMQVWPQTYSSILSRQQIIYMLDQMYSSAALIQQMQERHHFIIIYNASVPIGFASYSEIEPGIYKLHKIYIISIHQGRGTGRFVINQIINDVVPKGATALQLNVNRNNTAKEFYEKLGFKIIRSEDIDIGNGYFMNDYIMEKEIATTEGVVT